MLDGVELEPVGPADHEAEVAAALAALLEKAAEATESICSPPLSSSETKARSGSRRTTVLVLADLDQLRRAWRASSFW